MQILGRHPRPAEWDRHSGVEPSSWFFIEPWSGFWCQPEFENRRALSSLRRKTVFPPWVGQDIGAAFSNYGEELYLLSHYLAPRWCYCETVRQQNPLILVSQPPLCPSSARWYQGPAVSSRLLCSTEQHWWLGPRTRLGWKQVLPWQTWGGFLIVLYNESDWGLITVRSSLTPEWLSIRTLI